MFAVCGSVCAVCSKFDVDCCLLFVFVACCSVSAGCCLLVADWRALHVVCRLVFVVRSLPCVGVLFIV